MTVAELIEALKAFPSDMRVAMSSDPEGNSHYFLVELGTLLIESDTTYHIDAFHPDDLEEGDLEDLETVVCLWP